MSDDEHKTDDDDLDQLLADSGAELDALLGEIGPDDDEPLQDSAEPLAEDDGDDGFDELVTLPEVDDELDLSSDDEEAAIPVVEEVEEAESQAEPTVTEAMEEVMNNDPLAEVAAIAAERNAEVAKKGSMANGKGILIGLGSVALLALLAAVFAAWQAFDTSSRLEETTMKLQALQQRKAPTGSPVATADGELRGDLEKLMAQVNEMAATLDGSLVELREQNEKALAAVNERLETLEKQPAKPAATTPVPAARQLVEMIPAASTETTQPTTNGWSVNLISLSSEKDADEELARLRNLGVRAEKHRVEQDGRVWFRLRVSGFASRDGAMAYIETVKDKAGVDNTWVGRD